MSNKKETEFREIYGELTDAELEAYGAVIFRQIQEEEERINKENKETKRKENEDLKGGGQGY